jgi:hypothetical protein
VNRHEVRAPASRRTPPAGELVTAALVAVTVFIALIQVLTLTSGVAGLRLGTASATVMALGSIALAAWLARAHVRIARAARATDVPSSDVPHPRIVAVTIITVATGVWALFVWVRLWALALQRAPYDWDGLYYHLPALNAWVVNGRVTWLHGVEDVPFVNNPLGVEAFTFFAHHLFPSTTLTSALNLWYWPLGFLGILVIATRIGARGPWSWLAGALLAGVPIIICQSLTAYIDPAFAFTVIGTLAAVLVFLFDDERPAWTSTVLLGASLGLLAGSKVTGAPFAAALLLVSLVAVGLLRPWRSLRLWCRALGVAVIVAGLVGGYWYVRNMMYAGNPVYPYALRIDTLVLKPGYDPSASEGNLPERLRALPGFLRAPAAWLQQDAPIQGFDPTGGLGYLWIAFGLPAAIALAVLLLRPRPGGAARYPDPLGERTRPNATHAFLLLLVLVVLLFAIQPSSWWSRFTIWLHALGLPALVVMLQWIVGDASKLRGRLGVAALVVVVGVSVWESERTLALEWQRHRTGAAETPTWRGWLKPGPYLSSIDAIFPGLAASDGFDRLLAAPRVGRSPWSRFGTLLGGALAAPLGARELNALPSRPASADVERLMAQGVEWIIWDEMAAGPVPDVIAERASETHTWGAGTDTIFHIVRLAGRGDLSLPRSGDHD